MFYLTIGTASRKIRDEGIYKHDREVLRQMVATVSEKYKFAEPLQEKCSRNELVFNGEIKGKPDNLVNFLVGESKKYEAVCFYIVLINKDCEDPRNAASAVYIKNGKWKEQYGVYMFPKYTGDYAMSELAYRYKYVR